MYGILGKINRTINNYIEHNTTKRSNLLAMYSIVEIVVAFFYYAIMYISLDRYYVHTIGYRSKEAVMCRSLLVYTMVLSELCIYERIFVAELLLRNL